MKKIGKYNKIIKTSDLLFNRSIEIIYDYRYCEIFQKLKDLISFNLKGVVIKEKCTDDLTFEIYDCLQNKILIKKKNEEFRADDLFKEMFEKIKQNG
ncbi:hypothetical protein PFTANZ_01386 [Plasmodium falciparum Tanzania (2000708)]|nr:hypothetical protein PFTANZ_01386 [Plasmodium falciparum Tanzania (2000708)]